MVLYKMKFEENTKKGVLDAAWESHSNFPVANTRLSITTWTGALKIHVEVSLEPNRVPQTLTDYWHGVESPVDRKTWAQHAIRCPVNRTAPQTILLASVIIVNDPAKAKEGTAHWTKWWHSKERIVAIGSGKDMLEPPAMLPTPDALAKWSERSGSTSHGFGGIPIE